MIRIYGISAGYTSLTIWLAGPEGQRTSVSQVRLNPKLGPLGRYNVIVAALAEHRLNPPSFKGKQAAKRKQG